MIDSLCSEKAFLRLKQQDTIQIPVEALSGRKVEEKEE